MMEINAFLLTDIPRYCGMINCIKRGTAQTVAQSGRGVYMRESFSGIYFLAAADEAEAERLMRAHRLLPGEECEVFTRDIARYMQKTYPLSSLTECRQYVYLGKEPPVYEKRLDIVPAAPEDIPFVKRHYHLVNEDMIRLAAERKELYIARLGNVKAGFIGVHAEGCMGMLFVLPRFRRCGYGREMELFLTGEVMSRGLYPYGQVFITNKASLSLQATTVYSPGETEMFWFIIKK